MNTECFGSALVPGTSSCGTTSTLFDIDEDFFEIRTVGGYVNQDLAWRDRVFFSAGIRGDDNSAFGRDFGFVWYPSVSLSWVVAEEDWFPQLGLLQTLRLRGAFGTLPVILSRAMPSWLWVGLILPGAVVRLRHGHIKKRLAGCHQGQGRLRFIPDACASARQRIFRPHSAQSRSTLARATAPGPAPAPRGPPPWPRVGCRRELRSRRR